MAIRKKEIHGLSEEELTKKLAELQMERLTGESATKDKSLRLSIARIKTEMGLRAKHISQEKKKSGKHPVVSHPKIVSEKPLNTGKKKSS
ncbi:50S ribosomal protein L29 [Candidatus Micrarchaeota archaeon]|nr:50S ribosomal protein L29 [Candidatus Micrarchaeota archaeon]